MKEKTERLDYGNNSPNPFLAFTKSSLAVKLFIFQSKAEPFKFQLSGVLSQMIVKWFSSVDNS